MNIPGLNAETSLYKTSRSYQLGPAIGFANDGINLIYPSLDVCKNGNLTCVCSSVCVKTTKGCDCISLEAILKFLSQVPFMVL